MAAKKRATKESIWAAVSKPITEAFEAPKEKPKAKKKQSTKKPLVKQVLPKRKVVKITKKHKVVAHVKLPEVEATVAKDVNGVWLVAVTTHHPDPIQIAVNGRSVWIGSS